MANSDILELSEDGKTVIDVNDRSVKSITIPDGVTGIRYRAFYDCSSLQTIYIPDSVTEIGDAAFFGCYSLQSIDIPDSVTVIGDYAFSGCSSLQSIDVSKDNKHFASVDGVLFDKDLTTIVRFPQKYDVKEYVIPNSVTKIGDRAFHDCSSLQSIDIPNSVTEIGYNAFLDCSSLQSIDISDSVTKIGDRAFFGCYSLQSIDIPDSVTVIGDYAFSGCSSLQSINVSKNNKHFASVDGILFNKDLTTIVRFPQKYDVKEYVIPNSVAEIGDWAFHDCSSLQSIDIPDSVTEIGNYAFSGCSSLQSIDIPNSVTEIGYHAFSDCSSLQSIDISDSVTKIGDWAFGGCYSLEHIYLHCNNVEKLTLGDSIFQGVDFDKCILHVPSGTRWAYSDHDVFKRFKNIVTMGF